jgi:hypothetical protein
MGDIEHDDGLEVLGDPVTDAPVAASAGGMLTGVLITQRVADTVRVIQERASNELGSSGGDFLGQPVELASRAGPDVEAPATARSAHAAPAPFSR